MKLIRCLTLVALALSATGCVTRGFPTHGGGKRFFREQQIVSRAIDRAVEQLDFDSVPEKGNGLGLVILSVEDSGGGVQTAGGIGVGATLGSLLGFGVDMVPNQAGVAAATAPVWAGAGQGQYGSFAFESSDDLVYLKGALLGAMSSAGIPVAANEEQAKKNGTVYVLVSELGIDQSDFNLIIYGEKEVRARTALRAFLVTSNGVNAGVTSTPLGSGYGQFRYLEDYFFGFGPLSDSEPTEERDGGDR